MEIFQEVQNQTDYELQQPFCARQIPTTRHNTSHTEIYQDDFKITVFPQIVRVNNTDVHSFMRSVQRT